MSREIRITIDDDEIFERMKRRKDDLDLSWEEVLRRGLDRDEGMRSDAGPTGGEARAHGSPHAGRGPHGRSGGERGGSGPGSRTHANAGERTTRDPSEWSPFDPDFGRKLSEHITQSVAQSVPGGEESLSLEAEIDELEDAEDAVLAFPFLPDEESNQVPLRVNLRTSAEGLDVDVVAIRHGKGVSSMNRFGADARGTVTRKLATGEPAVLRLRGGAEEYPVAPALSWSRDRDGQPTVTEVEIADVRLNDE